MILKDFPLSLNNIFLSQYSYGVNTITTVVSVVENFKSFIPAKDFLIHLTFLKKKYFDIDKMH